MALQDGNNRPDPPDTDGDWFSQNAPPAPTQDAQLAQAVQVQYRSNLGRDASPQEIQAWIDATGGNILSIHNGILQSDEAKAYAARGAKPPPTKGPENPVDPLVDTTTTPGTITGNTGAVPQGVPSSGFGAAPVPYASNPNAPAYEPLPPYVAPTWTGGNFVNPTVEDLYASPGYQARLDSRLKGSARRQASQGTVLNGGSLVALDREAQDYATNEYQTLRNNTYDAYVQKYKQFTDSAGMDLNARTINANENQNTFANRTATYNTGNARTLSDYITNVTNNRNAELDYWNRLNDVNSTGAQLAGASR